jgi:REP element-mobilizing transposase RayT
MARPLRLQFPGALYHVTSRGNARAPIFLEDADRHRFLDILGEVVDRHRWRCHAYCLMTNHYHVLLETPEANLSPGMRQLNGLYTQGFNRRHERVGHVLQGRFSGILVERESHLLEVARYVVLNPVRAGIVRSAEDYRWSSLRAALGLARSPSWLTLESVLAPFGSRARYREFVREGVEAGSPWAELRGSLLGSDSFVERLAPRLDRKASQLEIPRRERLAHRAGLDELFPPEVRASRALRNERIREATLALSYTLAEVGRHLNLHYTTISRIAALPRPPKCDDSRPDPSGEVHDAEALRDVRVVDPVGVEARARVLGEGLAVDAQGLETAEVAAQGVALTRR